MAIPTAQRDATRTIVGRAIGWGSAAGVMIGGAVGTVAYPVLGTFLGGVVGALVGVLFGVLNGLVLAGASALTGEIWLLRIAAGMASGACALMPAAAWRLSATAAVWLLLVCAGLGLLLGPLAAFGTRPTEPGPRRARQESSPVLRHGAGVGLLGGAIVGGVIGAGIGLATYPGAAAAAVLEGVLFGCVPGVMVGLTVAAIRVSRHLRPRR